MDMTAVNTIILTGQASLASTDKSFQTEHCFVVDITRLFALQEVPDGLVAIVDNLVGTTGKDHVKALDEVHEARHLFIANGNIARRLVSHMDVVVLLHQSTDGATHRDDIVVRMGREDNNTLWIGLGAFRTCRIVDIRLAARPTRDGVLQFVEHFDIYQTGLSVELLNKMSETIVHIVLRREFQQGLADFLTQSYDLPPQRMARHRNRFCQI